MTKSARSIFYFAIYLLVTGILLCAIPEKFVALFKLPELPTAWARIIGLLVLILAGYYFVGARNNLKPFINGTIYLRSFFFIGTVILFVSGQMPKEILPLGAIDLIGAAWTFFSVKSEAKTS